MEMQRSYEFHTNFKALCVVVFNGLWEHLSTRSTFLFYFLVSTYTKKNNKENIISIRTNIVVKSHSL